MSVAVAKLVGISSPSRWSQVHVYFPESVHEILGLLMAVVTVEAAGGEEGKLAAVGSELIQRLHEAYYGDSPLTGLARVQQVVKSVQDEFGEGIAALGVGVIVRVDGKWGFYGVGNGGVEMRLLRGGTGVSLLGADGLGSVSGYLQTGDGLVVGSEDLCKIVDGQGWWDGWAKAVRNVDMWVDQLTPLVHSRESTGAAGVFVEIRDAFKPILTMPKLSVPVKNVVGVAGRHLWQSLWQKRKSIARNQELYVGKVVDKRKQVALAAGLVISILLMVSVVFGFVRVRTSEETKHFQRVREEVERLITESKELEDLNPLRARTLIAAAQKETDAYAQSGKVSRQGEVWVLETRKSLQQLNLDVLKIYENPASVFMDLHLVREESWGKLMDFDGKDVVILDEAHELLLTVNVGSKKAGVVGGGALLSQAKLAAVWAGRGFVLGSNGVVELDVVRKTSAVAIKPDDEWAEIGAMDVFGGNLYLLDKGRGQVYRYTAAPGGFGPRKDWLGRGVAPDFSQVVGMMIDGNIWILTKTGKVELYSQGTGRAIELTGLDTPLLNPEAIYTDEDSQHVYILDRGNKRVVVFTKEGMYEAQYKWEGIADVTDMVVSEKEKKILLLSGSIIYYLELHQ